MATAKQEETLRRLKALAERGVGGERTNAQALLDKLCAKYDVSIDGIDEDSKELHWFVHKQGENYKKLLNQCMYKVFGDHRPIYKRGLERILGAYCTAAESVEVEMDYDFYFRALKEEEKRLYRMFIQRQQLFPPRSPDDKQESSSVEITDEDIALYRGLTKKTRTLQLK